MSVFFWLVMSSIVVLFFATLWSALRPVRHPIISLTPDELRQAKDAIQHEWECGAISGREAERRLDFLENQGRQGCSY